MKSADDYEAWRREAYQQLVDLNEKVNATYGIMAWERFDYDLSTGELVFTHKGKPRVSAQVQLIGVVERDWQWAWANAGWWPDRILEDARKVKAFGETWGIEELTNAQLRSTNMDQLGWSLAAVAARVTGALGAYRPVDGPRSMFFLYRSLTLLS